MRSGLRFGLGPPGTRLDVLVACTKRGNWVPVLVNFAVEPRFAGSGSSHQFFFFAMTEFYQTQGAGPEARRCCFRAALPVLWGMSTRKG